jgi:hypothetical protein
MNYELWQCAHRYEAEVSTWSDSDLVHMCLHCDNRRNEKRPHVCDWACWSEHHPQEFREASQ